MSWSAGQREFTPLLMGLYWLCQVPNPQRMSGASQDEVIEWVVLEERKWACTRQGISAVLLLVLELMRRGYRVVMTHSPVVLEMIWAIQEFKQLGATEKDIRDLFSLKAEDSAKKLAQAALSKDYRVYFFDRQTQSGTSRRWTRERWSRPNRMGRHHRLLIPRERHHRHRREPRSSPHRNLDLMATRRQASARSGQAASDFEHACRHAELEPQPGLSAVKGAVRAWR
ncbi:MAG: hypothetical protein U1F21_13740 [Sphaerotilus natans]